MSFIKKLGQIIKSILPTPFTIAILLTILTFLLAFFISDAQEEGKNFFTTLKYWEQGLWDKDYLVFAFQMMLMLVLGHVIALTKPINNLISRITKYCNNTANAAAIVTFSTVFVSLFNWGLGLIFGAIFARKVGEYASENNIKLNYPIIGASGYSGLMVWHGGLSGSAPIKVAEESHLSNLLNGTEMHVSNIPDSISLSETVFSNMNITISLCLLFVLPIAMYFLGKKSKTKKVEIEKKLIKPANITIKGAEQIDHSRSLAYMVSFIILGYCIYKALILPEKPSLSVINPNFINLTLFGLGILLHSNFYNFLKGVDSAISGASGILIQFPLYFGIMGIMKGSGIAAMMSDFFVSISTEATFPIFTFFSAGIVNIFVPSGGGQWVMQGPIILEAACNIGVSFNKTIMALAYGDQLTNMLQPFWAIPLLAITGLKAKEILPYTLFLLIIGLIIFLTGLIIF